MNLRLLLACCLLTAPLFAQKKKNAPAPPAAVAVAPTPAADRLAGFVQRNRLRQNSLVSGLKFRNVGPTVMSGRVTDLDVNPADPTEFYVAYASGGLWHTRTNGLSFRPLFEHEAAMTLGDIAMDWPHGRLWLGTGESNASRSSYAGVGLYLSTDGGQTWQHRGLAESHHIGRVVLHPADTATLWVAAVGHLYSPNAERGIFKTTTGGRSWKKVLGADEHTGGIDLAADPTNPNRLLAALWQRSRRAWDFTESGPHSGIYESLDGGETWKLLTGGGSGFPKDENTGRIGLSVFQGNPRIVYAIVDNQTRRKEDREPGETELSVEEFRKLTPEQFQALDDALLADFLDRRDFPEQYSAKQLKQDVRAGKFKLQDLIDYTFNANEALGSSAVVGAEVYRSDDGGHSWKKQNEKNLREFYSTYGYYFGQIWVAPSDEQTVIVAGVPLLRSTDGGKTFTEMDRPNVHADHHALWINPRNKDHIINGNDGGLNITYDSGESWFKANMLPVAQCYSVSVDMARPYNVYVGLQDNGCWYGPSTFKAQHNYGVNEGNQPWKLLVGGDGMMTQIDPRDNRTVYAGFQFGNYFRINTLTNERKFLKVSREIGESRLRWNWESPILLSRHNADIVYFGSNKFHRSLDRGDSWQTLSGDLTGGPRTGDVPFGTLTVIEESPKRFGLLYTGSDDGLLHRSKDGGYTWTPLHNTLPGTLPGGLWVSQITASSHQQKRVYVTLNGYRNDHFVPYLFVSENEGDTWQRLGTDLPAEPINVVREDPVNPGLLYVGTDNGLYVSLNGGQHFQGFGPALPAVAVHDLVVHPRDRELVVGTHGRSVYIADVQYLQQLSDTLLAKTLHAFPVKEITASPAWGRVRPQARGQEFASIELPYFVREKGLVSIEIRDAKGLKLQTITDTAVAGLNAARYDLTLQPAAAEAYEKALNASRKKDEKAIGLKKAENGAYYLQPGNYELVMQKNGQTARTLLVIKAPERRPGRRLGFPEGSASPGAWEAWIEHFLEDVGLPEKK